MPNVLLLHKPKGTSFAHLSLQDCWKLRNEVPLPKSSCVMSLQKTGMLWVEHQGEVIHCDSSCWGVWLPALAPYITEAQGITEICWAQSFHARNRMPMSPPCSALGLKLSFRWCCWLLTPALDPRQGVGIILCSFRCPMYLQVQLNRALEFAGETWEKQPRTWKMNTTSPSCSNRAFGQA